MIAGKRKVMILDREEGLECEVHVDVVHLGHVSEFKYLGCVWMNQVQMGQHAVGMWQAKQEDGCRCHQVPG